MNHRITKQLVCVLMVLCLCLSLPLFAGQAHADSQQALLVLVDKAAMGSGADKLVAADKAVIDRVLGDTTVCPETAELLKGDGVVEAELSFTGWGVRALTTLSDGSKVPVSGHAVLERRGEYLFGGESKFLLYGFQEENGKTRFYSSYSVPKFDFLIGRMVGNTTIFIQDKFYTVDENGYLDMDNPQDRDADEKLWARYWRADLCDGLPPKMQMTWNASLCVEHAFDWDHPTYHVDSTETEQGYNTFVCPRCGGWETIKLPLKGAK